MNKQEREQRRKISRIASELSSRSHDVREQGRAALGDLADDALIALLRLQVARYSRVLMFFQVLLVLAKIMGGVACVILLGLLAEAGWNIGLVLLIVGALMGVIFVALGRRAMPGPRYLQGMIPSLEALLARCGETLSIGDLWPGVDRTTVAKMRVRCPDLEGLLPPFSAPARPQDERTLRARLKQIHYFLRNPFEVTTYTLAALQDLEEIGNEEFLPLVRELAEMQSTHMRMRIPLDNPEVVQAVKQAAVRCLAALEAREELNARVLLRGSAPPGAETLLRASHGVDEIPPEQLLRASTESE